MRALPSTFTNKTAHAPFTTLDFVDSVMRGTGQVMLQNNSYTGVLLLIGICLNSRLLAAASLLGTVTSTGTALLLSANKAHIRDGLFGFNGALVAVALLVYLPRSPLVWACVLLAAAASTIVMIGATRLLQVWRLPALSTSFVLISWCLFLATTRLGQLNATRQLIEINLPKTDITTAAITVPTVIYGMFNGIAQVFLQNDIATGIVFTLALLVSSRRTTVLALAGSLIGVLMAWGAGATDAAIHAGVFGFNNVLTAIAVGSLLFVPGRATSAYAVLAMVTAPVIDAATSIVMQTFGLPSLTLPFLLTTWLFLLASTGIPAIKLVHNDY